MKRPPRMLAWLAYVLAFPVAGLGAGAPPPPVEKTMVQGNTAFGTDLYARLRAKPGNLFFSPLSLSSALAMTYAGARGQTAAEMARVLHLPAGEPDPHQAMGGILHGLNEGAKKGAYELSIANALWGQKGEGFRPEFLRLLQSSYGAPLHEMDFRHQPEPARQTINHWAEEQTRNRIQNLLPPRSVDTLTVLVLTNAVYFKGKWSHPFRTDQTRPADFFLSGGQKKSVPMMSQTTELGYLDGGSFQAVELPYQGDDLSMLLLVPKANDGLPDLEKQLTAPKLDGWTAQLHATRVSVSLPKFRLTLPLELVPVLKQLGMPAAFQGADFSGMNGKRNLAISNVVHKAFVDVNEEGTEAAAASGVMMKRAAVALPHVVRADHPFLFLIRERKAGSVLFLGRLSNPE